MKNVIFCIILLIWLFIKLIMSNNFEDQNPEKKFFSSKMAGDSKSSSSVSKDEFMDILEEMKGQNLFENLPKEERYQKIKKIFDNRGRKSPEEIKEELKRNFQASSPEEERSEEEKIFSQLEKEGQFYYYNALSREFIYKTIKDFCDNYKEKSGEKSKIEQIKDKLKDLNTEERHLKDYGLEPLLKGYLAEISQDVGDKEKMEQIRRKVLDEFFSKNKQDEFPESDRNKRSAKLQKRLVEILEEEKERAEKRKKAS